MAKMKLDPVFLRPRFGRNLTGVGALAFCLVLALAVSFPGTAMAYVGPGAGIAVATTALAFVVSFFLAVVGILFWPIRYLIRQITRKRPPKKSQIKRAIIIGLDGLDPKVCRRMLAKGKLQNMARLQQLGSFTDLKTTYPSMSPVAWSSFATGVNPAKHGIYDFLVRDPKSYLPDLSSAEVKPPRRHLNIGKFQLPLGKPQIRLLQRSRPFWHILGKYQVPCSILRVPITFPAEAFEGTLLSAMCVPDLEGTQGSFSFFTSDPSPNADMLGGRRIPLETADKDGNKDGGNHKYAAAMQGPGNPCAGTGPSWNCRLP